jgi:hypothetical protein
MGKTVQLTENVLLLNYHVIKTYSDRKHKAPLKYSNSLKLRPSYPRGKRPSYPLYMNMSELQNRTRLDAG